MNAEEALAKFGMPLARSFYARDAVTAARELLGCVLVRVLPEGAVAGRISETEAYRQDDPSSHSFSGKRVRNAPMFGPPGHAYIYFTYGAHHCLNVVTGIEGMGEAVLIRALEPLVGTELLSLRRGLNEGTAAPEDPIAAERARVRNGQALCGGPGRLCQAFGLDRTMNGWDMTLGSKLWIASPVTAVRPEDIMATPRIGISKAQDFPWRFTLRGDPFTSRGLTK